MATPADRVRLESLAKLRRDVHESNTGGSAHPFIGVNREDVGTRVPNIEPKRAEGLGAVDEYERAVGMRDARNFGDGRAEASGVVHLADRHQAGARVDR